MSAYRFCRTDDIALLVDALRRCWWPHRSHEPEPTPASFKHDIRDLQVWCSSCVLAFDGSEPVGVLIGARRSQETLLHRLAVHPDHLRRGHGRHLVSSLVAKLAILGPPWIVAEVPAELSAMRALLLSCGFGEEVVLTDYVLDGDATAGADTPSAGGSTHGTAAAHRGVELLAIPVTVEDLEANGLLDIGTRTDWERGPETLRARRTELRGLALVADDRIAAYALWRPARWDGGTELAALRVTDAPLDAPGVLAALLDRLRVCCPAPVRSRRVHPEELPPAWLADESFVAQARTVRYARTAAHPG